MLGHHSRSAQPLLEPHLFDDTSLHELLATDDYMSTMLCVKIGLDCMMRLKETTRHMWLGWRKTMQSNMIRAIVDDRLGDSVEYRSGGFLTTTYFRLQYNTVEIEKASLVCRRCRQPE